MKSAIMMKMKTAFKRALIVFLSFTALLCGMLIVLIIRYSQYGSLPDTLQMVDFRGLLLAALGASVLSLISVALTFWLARAWASEHPELGERIVRLALAVSLGFIIVFGALAGGIIILRTLWTIGFF